MWLHHWCVRCAFHSFMETDQGTMNHSPSAKTYWIYRVRLLPKQTIQIILAKADMECCMTVKSVVVVQSLNRVWLFTTPWTAACPASLPFTISWSLLKLMSIELVITSNHLILCCSLLLCPQSFPASGSFLGSQLFTSGSQSTGVSTSASVIPMNIQDWFPLGLAGLISLQSKGLSKNLLQHHSLKISILYCLALTSVHDYWKNHSFDYTHLWWQSDVFAF